MNIAILLAAGSGRRFGGRKPKQLIQITGQPIYKIALSKFKQHPKIDKIIMVVPSNSAADYNTDVQLVDGGATRQKSVYNGLIAAAKYNPKNVLIHDCARPFVSVELIDDIIANLNSFGAVTPTLQPRDSIYYNGQPIDRAKAIQIQTPQGFDFDTIYQAHQQNTDNNFTDDTQLILATGGKVKYIAGDEDNFKITYPYDITRAEHIMASNNIIKTGLGFDVHEFESGNHVTLCGINVPHTHKLKGHSDADVAMHAITDALLGAIGAGDIGEHFPPSDAKWAGTSSDIFLKHALQLANNAGYKINNADLTIICEAPKITPHKAAMQKNIASILQIDIDAVNIKATTTEGLGFTGRKEGIAAQAIATVNKYE